MATDKCDYQKEKWATSLLTKESFVEKISFKNGCDLQGTYTVKMDQFFPIEIAIRNHKSINKLKGNIKFEVVFEKKALLKISMKEMKTKGSDNIQFDLAYGVYIDPLSKDPLGDHKGGELTIYEHNGKKLNKKIPLTSRSFK